MPNGISILLVLNRFRDPATPNPTVQFLVSKPCWLKERREGTSILINLKRGEKAPLSL
jgi:hypothetical protein